MSKILIMRKNGSRLISIKQYRLTDLFLFAVITVIGELVVHFANKAFGDSAVTYRITFVLPITLLVMMRWGWFSVFYALADGVLCCILNGGGWQSYIIYPLGFAFAEFLLILIKFTGKEKIAGKWYFSALFVLAGWVLMNFGLTVLMAAFGNGFVNSLAANFGFGITGLMSLALALLIILVMRRLDGMFEDQKHYLLRLDEERREKARRDEFGDDPIEIDAETLSILSKRGDGLD